MLDALEHPGPPPWLVHIVDSIDDISCCGENLFEALDGFGKRLEDLRRRHEEVNASTIQISRGARDRAPFGVHVLIILALNPEIETRARALASSQALSDNTTKVLLVCAGPMIPEVAKEIIVLVVDPAKPVDVADSINTQLLRTLIRLNRT